MQGQPPIGRPTLWERIKKRQLRLRHDDVLYGEQGAEWALALTEELEAIHSRIDALEASIKKLKE